MKGLNRSFTGRTFDGIFTSTFKISLRVDQTATGTLLGNEGVADEISLNKAIGPGGRCKGQNGDLFNLETDAVADFGSFDGNGVGNFMPARIVGGNHRSPAPGRDTGHNNAAVRYHAGHRFFRVQYPS